IHKWRRKLDEQGIIAWPIKASGTLRERDRETLFAAWRHLVTKDEPRVVSKLDEQSGVDVQDVVSILEKVGVSPRARSFGYEEAERAMLFDRLDDRAEAVFPPFIGRILRRLLKERLTWTLDAAEREWFWGYTWEGIRAKDIFLDWMALLCDLGFAKESSVGKT